MNKQTLIALALLLTQQTALAEIPISITKFSNKSGSSNCRHSWDWWDRYLGDGFKEMLANELLKSEKIALFERETIREIYDSEHELINSDDVSLKRGQFKKAKYTLVGSVTEFEYCASSKSGSVNVGAVAGFFGVSAPDVNLGLKGASAKIGIDVRVIDTQTGRVLKTIHAQASADDRKFDLGTEYGDFSSQENSPMGKAARSAIASAAKEALTVIK